MTNRPLPLREEQEAGNEAAPKERPILFQGAMVRALLAGTKTQTRRLVKGERAARGMESGWYFKPYGFLTDGQFAKAACPYGQPRDRLWVRESWMDLAGTGIEARDPHTLKPTRYAFMADTTAGSYADQCRKDYGLKWRPSIHMPRAACRILLEVTSVRVERLQAISEAGALAEGIDDGWLVRNKVAPPRVQSYRYLWEDINGAGSWDANPWVWAVEFRRIV